MRCMRPPYIEPAIITAMSPFPQGARNSLPANCGAMLRPGAIKAPAKINLTLEVLPARADGYHGVRSVMLPIALYDELHWEPGEQFGFRVLGDAPQDESNLAVRAFRALDIEPALDMTLEKNIPTGGGLGGGSSDAAAVL